MLRAILGLTVMLSFPAMSVAEAPPASCIGFEILKPERKHPNIVTLGSLVGSLIITNNCGTTVSLVRKAPPSPSNVDGRACASTSILAGAKVMINVHLQPEGAPTYVPSTSQEFVCLAETSARDAQPAEGGSGCSCASAGERIALPAKLTKDTRVTARVPPAR